MTCIKGQLVHMCVMAVTIGGLTAISGCTLIPTYISGVYHCGFEESSFRTQDYPGETWWVESPSIRECAEEAISANAPGYPAWAFVRVLGIRSWRREPPAYGHLGMYERSLQVLKIIEIRPVTEDDLQQVGIPVEYIPELADKRDDVRSTSNETQNTGGQS